MSLSMVFGIPTTATLRCRLLISCADNQDALLINCYFHEINFIITDVKCQISKFNSVISSSFKLYIPQKSYLHPSEYHLPQLYKPEIARVIRLILLLDSSEVIYDVIERIRHIPD